MVSQHLVKIILEIEDKASEVARKVENQLKKIGTTSQNAFNIANQQSARMGAALDQVARQTRNVGITGQSSFMQLTTAQRNALLGFANFINKINEMNNNLNKIGSTGNSTFLQLSNGSQKSLTSMDSLSQSVRKTGVDFKELERNAIDADFKVKSVNVSPELGNSVTGLKTKFSGLGIDIDSVKTKLTGLGSSAKTSITSGFSSAIDSVKGKVEGLKGSISSVNSSFGSLNNSSRSAGSGLGFLRSAASMTVGMVGYDLVNSMAMSARESINAAGNFQAFGQRMGMTGSEIEQFRSHCDSLQGSFKKVDMTAVGASALELGVKLKLPKESMDELTKTTAVMSSAFVKEGRTQTDAILAVSDALDGQFRRLQELGINQEMLKNNGWDGDINNKTSLLQAMNKTLDDMGFTETAMQVNTLDEAYQMLTVYGGKLLGSILIPMTPTLIQIMYAIIGVVDGIKGFVGAFNGLPDGAKIGILVGVFGLLATVIWITVIPSIVNGLMSALISFGSMLGITIIPELATLTGAFSLLATTIWAAMAPLLPWIALAAGIAIAVFEIGKAFGWWTDVSSMIDAVWAGIQRLWQAFINNPNVQATIKAIGDAWNWVCQSLQPVIQWGQQVWNSLFPPSASGEVDIVRMIIDLFSFLGNLLATYVSTYLTIFTGAWEALVFVFTTVWQVVSTLIEVFSEFSNNQLSLIDVLTMVWELISTSIMSFLGMVVVYIIQWAMDIWNQAVMAGTNFLNSIVMFFSQIPARIWGLLSFAITYVLAWATLMIAKARQAGSSFLNGVISFISQLPSRIWGFLSSTLGRIGSFASQAVSKAISTGSGMVTGLVNQITGLPGKVYNEFIKIKDRIAEAGAQLIAKAMHIGQDIVNAILNAMGIHSPGIIQEKVVTEFVNMLSRVKDTKKSALEAGKTVGDAIVEGMENTNIEDSLANAVPDSINASPDVNATLNNANVGAMDSTLNSDTTANNSAINNVDTPSSPTMDTSQYASGLAEVDTLTNDNNAMINQSYMDLLANMGGSMDGMLNKDLMTWLGIQTNDQLALSNISTAQKNNYNQMYNHLNSSLNNMVNKDRLSWNTIRNTTSTQLTNIRNNTTQVTNQLMNAWSVMATKIVASAEKIKTDSTSHFDKLSNTIGTFYRKLQNPGSWGAGSGSGSPRSTRVIGRSSGGMNKISNLMAHSLRKDSGAPSTITVSQAKNNPCVDPVVLDYIGATGNVNVEDLIKGNGFNCLTNNPTSGAGWEDAAPKGTSYIKNTSREWDMRGPQIMGHIDTGLAFQVKDFETGTPNISFDSFKTMAEALFTAIPYSYYSDSDKCGNWVAALESGSVNCSDGADALCALARTCGLSAEKVHCFWGNEGHFATRINGQVMDTTAWQKLRSWTSPKVHGYGSTNTTGNTKSIIRKSTGITPNLTNEVTTDTNTGKQFNTQTGEYVEEIQIVHSGEMSIKVEHDLKNVPEGLNEEEIAQLITENTENENWIKKLVNNKTFQEIDSIVKERLNRKDKRNNGV